MRYRVHRLKEAQSQSFRFTAHTGGAAVVKSRDYTCADNLIEADSPYAAWKQLNESKEKLRPGDLLEPSDENGHPASLLICKYIGFEPAQWFIPELKTASTCDTETVEQSAEMQ